MPVATKLRFENDESRQHTNANGFEAPMDVTEVSISVNFLTRTWGNRWDQPSPHEQPIRLS